MFRKFLVLLLILGCLGCATNTTGWKPVCRHKALYAASVVGERYPVRIACGDNHVEAQALIGGVWWPLALDEGWVVVKDRGFRPSWYESFGDFANHFDRWFEEERRKNGEETD